MLRNLWINALISANLMVPEVNGSLNLEVRLVEVKLLQVNFDHLI